ncbi:MAG TPA: hypothetical protein VJP88_04255, partial [Caulobacteraceae bacterium]|nr:hypothetical protein [Caulobacteraceae bacterium]
MGGDGKSQTTGQDPPSDLKALVERALVPITAVGAFATIVVTAVTNGDKLAALLAERPVSVGAVVAFGVAAVVWTGCSAFRDKLGLRCARTIRWIAMALILAAYAGAVSFPDWCRSARLCHAAEWKPVRLGLLVSTAMAAERPLVVESVAVDTTRSSYRLSTTNLSIHAVPEAKARLEVAFDQRMHAVFRGATCRSVDGEQPILDALPIWRDLLSKRGDQGAAAKLANYEGYRKLITTGGRDAFYDAIPNAAELGQLKSEQKARYDIVMRWLANCVGIGDPVLLWQVSNNSNRVLVISGVEYNVIDVGQTKGGGPGAVPVIDVESQELAHRVGLQRRTLNPNVQLPPGGVAAIRIRYILDSTDWGYTWLLQPRFVTTD